MDTTCCRNARVLQQRLTDSLESGIIVIGRDVFMVAFQRILLPVDGSANSQRALAYAVYLAELCQAAVGILHVVNLSQAISAIGQVDTGGYIPGQVLEDLKEGGRQILDKAVQQLPATVAAQGFLEIGTPPEVIVTFANKHGYDLIVMGSRGRSAIKGLLLGSVSSYVLHHAACPVMVTK
ncbi:MAG TPA: universal stress protein [Methylomusa anaerophila]|uniref:Stress response protein NhaX n=1 Tax=Methylomusa anaerophila TaxID=1930071 RepID=A0A348AK01_9FIRM|nr:universal stress protein [Methylomusa anaerophila]BBB91399.1 stress response protein NhaX [Methylomusa anaerophila]HML90176.1 universal stress protein [Methylomusa anaerophila]